LRSEGGGSLTLERDRGALRVVLVIAVRTQRGGHHLFDLIAQGAEAA
jgi:hypothetical protein